MQLLRKYTIILIEKDKISIYLSRNINDIDTSSHCIIC